MCQKVCYGSALPHYLFNAISSIKAKIFRSDLDQEMVAATIMGSIMGVHDLFETRWSVEELAQKLFLLHLAMLTSNVNG